MPEYITYLRVSTQGQRQSGLGIEAQRKLVNDHIQKQNGTLIHEFIETESGRKVDVDDRPQFHLALQMIKDHPGAKMLIARTDRIARDLHFISGLLKNKVPLIVAGHEHMTKLEWHMHAMIAEHEADLISTRTRQALAEAKKRGVMLGCPKEKMKYVQAIATERNAYMTKQWRKGIRPLVDSILQDRSVYIKSSLKRPERVHPKLVAEKLNNLGVRTYYNTPWTYDSAKGYLKREGIL